MKTAKTFAAIAMAASAALLLAGCVSPPAAPSAEPVAAPSAGVFGNLVEFLSYTKANSAGVSFCFTAKARGNEAAEARACKGAFTRAIVEESLAGKNLWGTQIRVEGEQAASAASFLRSFYWTGEIVSTGTLYGSSNMAEVAAGTAATERISVGMDDTAEDWATRLAEFRVAEAGTDLVLADPAFAGTAPVFSFTGHTDGRLAGIVAIVANGALLFRREPAIAEPNPMEKKAASAILWSQYPPVVWDGDRNAFGDPIKGGPEPGKVNPE